MSGAPWKATTEPSAAAESPHANDRGADWRQCVYLLLIVAFFAQTGLVYFDPRHAEIAAPLSEQARQGLSLWRANNCQVCHQIHGFGGFLGPDLTNLISRRPEEDFTDVLVEGRKQMPAFGFDEPQREAIIAFLTEVDRTGASIPQLTSVRRDADLARLVPDYLEKSGEAAPPAVLRGDALLRANACGACHVPFAVGLRGAPDLTTILSRTTRAEAKRAILESKGIMPAFPHLSEREAEEMIDALEWMRERRSALGGFVADREKGREFRWSAIPWFEYPRP